MKRFSKPVFFLFALMACFALGFSWRDLQQGRPPSTRALSSLVGVKVIPSNLSGEQVFKQTYNRIRAQYIKEVKPQDLKYAGMEGLVASLGDPHTVFMVPRTAKDFSDSTRGTFAGVGAKLQPDPLGARVATVFEDGPAYRAGLRASNVITAVDGVSVAGKDIEPIVDRIKGKEGTVVRLTVIQPGKDKPVVLTVRRARIQTPTVEGKFLPESGVGYLSVLAFAEPTTSQFDRELAKLERNELKGLVIDLRGNPGGLLETAVDLLSRFVENRTVVQMRFKNGREEVARTYFGSRHEFTYPVAILMNEDSASAAEIFAGALRDYRKATLVGEHSYGKASVQNVFQLIDTSSAKITIAKYYLPASGFIGRKVDEDGGYVSGGLIPDVPVELNLDLDPELGNPKTDSQLAKAIEVVLSKS